MTKYALFLEPDRALSHYIDQIKKKVENFLPLQPYCNHPPHCTLIFTCLRAPELAIKELKALFALQTPIIASVNRPLCFYDDVCTGGHTMTLAIEEENGLMHALQSKLATALRAYVDFSKIPAPSGFLNRKPFKESYEKYGFPFVGGHWIPHFTIASLKVKKTDPFLLDLMNLKFSFECAFSNFSLVEVTGDDHVVKENFRLD